MAKLILILGGVRSGKSRFAQELALRVGGSNVLYLATAEARDEEMARRIRIHRQSRPAGWETRERPLELGAALRELPDDRRVIVIDCVTLLVSNALFACCRPLDADATEAQVRSEIDALLEASLSRHGTVIVVSGEVGLGLVPENPLGRLYRDLLGWANQSIAVQAAATYLMVAGYPVNLKHVAATVDEAARLCSGSHESH